MNECEQTMRAAAETAEQVCERKYPLLESLLTEKGSSLKGSYTYRDLEQIFGCSKRALQDLVRDGRLTARDLPGRAHWLSVDLEEFLQNSVRTPKSGAR